MKTFKTPTKSIFDTIYNRWSSSFFLNSDNNAVTIIADNTHWKPFEG